jgi:hypothetical protein
LFVLVETPKFIDLFSNLLHSLDAFDAIYGGAAALQPLVAYVTARRFDVRAHIAA